MGVGKLSARPTPKNWLSIPATAVLRKAPGLTNSLNRISMSYLRSGEQNDDTEIEFE